MVTVGVQSRYYNSTPPKLTPFATIYDGCLEQMYCLLGDLGELVMVYRCPMTVEASHTFHGTPRGVHAFVGLPCTVMRRQKCLVAQPFLARTIYCIVRCDAMRSGLAGLLYSCETGDSLKK